MRCKTPRLNPNHVCVCIVIHFGFNIIHDLHLWLFYFALQGSGERDLGSVLTAHKRTSNFGENSICPRVSSAACRSPLMIQTGWDATNSTDVCTNRQPIRTSGAGWESELSSHHCPGRLRGDRWFCCQCVMKCWESAGCAEDVSTVTSMGDGLWMVNEGDGKTVMKTQLCACVCSFSALLHFYFLSTFGDKQLHLVTDYLRILMWSLCVLFFLSAHCYKRENHRRGAEMCERLHEGKPSREFFLWMNTRHHNLLSRSSVYGSIYPSPWGIRRYWTCMPMQMFSRAACVQHLSFWLAEALRTQRRLCG